jgi:hypothetical protein
MTSVGRAPRVAEARAALAFFWALVHVDGIDFFFLRQFLLGFHSVASVHKRFSPIRFGLLYTDENYGQKQSLP